MIPAVGLYNDNCAACSPCNAIRVLEPRILVTLHLYCAFMEFFVILGLIAWYYGKATRHNLTPVDGDL